jgi:hypothetical protein
VASWPHRGGVKFKTFGGRSKLIQGGFAKGGGLIQTVKLKRRKRIFLGSLKIQIVKWREMG